MADESDEKPLNDEAVPEIQIAAQDITIEVEEAPDAADETDAAGLTSAQPIDEDRTEDQVPEITRDAVPDEIDPMTTSMEGIEELPDKDEDAQTVGPDDDVEELPHDEGAVSEAGAESGVEGTEGAQSEADGAQSEADGAQSEADGAQSEAETGGAQSEAGETGAESEAGAEGTEVDGQSEPAEQSEAGDRSEAVESQGDAQSEAAEQTDAEEPRSTAPQSEAGEEEANDEDQMHSAAETTPAPETPAPDDAEKQFDVEVEEAAAEEQQQQQPDDAVGEELVVPEVQEQEEPAAPAEPEQPAEEPAAEPVAEPVEEPAAEPVAEPEPEPEVKAEAEEPAPEPEPVAAAADDAPPPPTPKSTGAGSRKTSLIANGSIPGTPKAVAQLQEEEAPATPKAASPKAAATPKSAAASEKQAFTFDEKATAEESAAPAEEEKFEDAVEEAPKGSEPTTPAAQSTRTASRDDPVALAIAISSGAVNELPPIPEPEPAAEPEVQKSAAEEADSAPVRRAQSPSPPPRAGRRSSPPAREQRTFDEDSYRQMPPPRVPTTTSFSSWSPPDKTTYTPLTPFASNPAHKARTEHTQGVHFRPGNTLFTSHFDDLVNTGPFSSALYATNRLLERSRSRTRERHRALRSQRSASNYFRYAAQHMAPLRTREYSQPPTSHYSRPPSRSTSFVSFLDYAGAKQGELSRSGSRSSLYDSAVGLSRSSSRANVDHFVGAGRLSRVDSYVAGLHEPYEWSVPAAHALYRSSSRGPASFSVFHHSTPVGPPTDVDSTRRAIYHAQDAVTPLSVRSVYETAPLMAANGVSAVSRLFNGFTRLWAN